MRITRFWRQWCLRLLFGVCLFLWTAAPMADLGIGFLPQVSQVQADYQPDWGVLAMNYDHSEYSPGDAVKMAFAVLNTEGKMVCDASLEFSIVFPDGRKQILGTKNNGVQVNPECHEKKQTERPDFQAEFVADQIGVYRLQLTATTAKGSKTISDTLRVSAYNPITIERTAPTRLYPNATYQVTLKVHSQVGFHGKITEMVPEVFTVSEYGSGFLVKQLHQKQVLQWSLDVLPGQVQEVSYQFTIPKISPEFYELGPAKIVNHWNVPLAAEARAWQLAADATFSMMTGYYVGTGTDNRAITGLGFSPDLVMIKDASANGSDGILWKSTSMSGEVTAKLGDSEADISTNVIQSLDSDGFTLGTNSDVNGSGVVFYYVAFDGSDCTSSGTFCVLTYSGNSTNPRSFTSVGFQPDFLSIKRSGASGGIWASSAHTAGYNQWWISRVQDTSGFINSLDATGFTVTATNEVNATGSTYWAFAFKNVSGAFYVGSYTGNGTSQSITAPGFKPDAIFTKNATNGTTQQALVFNTAESYGQLSHWATDALSTTATITSLDTNGFSVGSNAAANDNTQTFQYFAFKGNAAATATGRYKMAVGSYTGNGTSQSVTSIGFQPDLVIIKHVDQATDQFAVWNSRMMPAANCAYFATNVANITSQCITLNSDGFSVGTSATVNTNADTYYWEAFGNAWRPDTRTGATDFLIGAYIGNAVDSRDITALPFQPDIVVTKSSTTQLGIFRSSATSGDLSSYFSATAEAADRIQALNSDGFQLGANNQVNIRSTTAPFYYFMFKTGPDTKTGYYSGNGGTQSITAPNIQPNLVWVKRTTAVAGVFKPSALAGDSTQYFSNTANVTGRITSLDTTGFSVGNNTETSTSGTNNYLYVAWKIPTTYTQNDFEWFVTANSVTLTDAWPPPAGGADIAENTAITQMPATNTPSKPGDKIRIQMNLTVAGSRMGSTQQAFKLQYSAASDCTVASSWTDVGAKASGSIWRLFDEASIGDSTAQVNQISTSNASSEGYYSEINASATNPNAVAVGNNTEWDWPVQNNGAAVDTTYCFRMVLDDGTALSTYNSDSYPKLTTAPSVDTLMRHGNFFVNQVEQGFLWND